MLYLHLASLEFTGDITTTLLHEFNIQDCFFAIKPQLKKMCVTRSKEKVKEIRVCAHVCE